MEVWWGGEWSVRDAGFWTSCQIGAGKQRLHKADAAEVQKLMVNGSWSLIGFFVAHVLQRYNVSEPKKHAREQTPVNFAWVPAGCNQNASSSWLTVCGRCARQVYKRVGEIFRYGLVTTHSHWPNILVGFYSRELECAALSTHCGAGYGAECALYFCFPI